MKKKISTLLMVALAAMACQKEEPIAPSIELDETKVEYTIPSNGGEQVVEFNTNYAWTAKVKEAECEWLSLSPKSGEAGKSKFTLIAEPNKTNETLNATVIINAEGLSKEVKVTLLQKNAMLLKGETLYENIDKDGATFEIAIDNNLAHRVVSGSDWISVEAPTTKAMVTNKYTIKVLPNEGEAREGRVSIVSTDSEVKDIIIVFKQLRWEPIFEVTYGNPETELVLGNTAGTATMTIKTNVELTVDLEQTDWLTMKNENNVFTFTATANEAFATRRAALKITTPVEGIGLDTRIKQYGHANPSWSIAPLADIKGFDKGITRLAQTNNMLVVKNGNNVFVLDAKNGKTLQTIALPSDMNIEDVTSDDKGNILIGSLKEVQNGEKDGKPVMQKHLYISRIKDLSKLEPEILIDFNCANIAGGTHSNIRVHGDLNANAVITATVGGNPSYILAWQIENGKIKALEETKWGPKIWYYLTAPYQSWNAHNCAAISAGTSFAEGAYYIGYGKPYSLHYFNQIDNNKTKSTEVFKTGAAGNDNFTCLSAAEFKGKKYLAYTQSAHFDYSACKLVILDVTDPLKVNKVYEQNIEGKFSGKGAFADVILYTTQDKMYAYYVDVNKNTLGGVEIKY